MEPKKKITSVKQKKMYNHRKLFLSFRYFLYYIALNSLEIELVKVLNS